jgi:TonB-dependent receptor
MYEQIEIIAGQTPDKRADSLGGQLNLKTRSPLAMRERRRFNYSAGIRHFPSWADRNVQLARSPTHPDVSVNYTEVFDVRGGTRNLGVVLGGSYQEVVNPFDWDFLQYQTTTNPVAFFRDYDKRSGINYRYISGFSGRVDYRWSQATRVSFRYQYNAGSEPYFQYTFVNPFAGNQIIYDPATAATGAIEPGFTLNRTQIRPVTNSQMLLTPRKYSFTSKNPTGTLAFEHDWGRWKVDHAYRWSNTHWDLGHGRKREGGQITMRTRDPIGFTLDNSDLNGRVFTQTSGTSVYDAAAYTTFQTAAANTTLQPVPTTSNRFDKRDIVSDINEVTANINASYSFETSIPLVAKFGLDTVNRRVNNRQVYPQRWYSVVGIVPSGPLVPLTEFERQHGGQRLPVFDPAAVATTLGNAALWYQDVNFTATSQYTNRKIMEEGVDAAYVQAQAKMGRFTVVGGVRGEFVTTDTFTYFRTRSTPIAAEPDHFKRAALDFAKQSTAGDYQKYFPSIHVAYDITTDLKARTSWSTSYARPTLANLVPSVTANDTSQTVTIGDPSLRPQMGRNIDLKLEYYFVHSGIISATVYRKDIEDFIGGSLNSGATVPSTPDNGFDGLYGGYTIFRPRNLGSARLEGFEIEYKQRMAFLPGLLKGLTIRANYTYLKTQGNFGGATEIQGRQLVNFVPRAFNGGLQYNYRNFGASFDLNQTGEYPVAVSLTSPGLNAFRRKLTTMNAGVSYRIRPDVTLFLNAANLTENGPEHYLYSPDRPRQLLIAPMAIKFGVTGQF